MIGYKLVKTTASILGVFPVHFSLFVPLSNAVLSELLKIYLSIYLPVQFFFTSCRRFRKPNAITFCFSIDLFLNFLLSWLLLLHPSTLSLDVLFSFSPMVPKITAQ